MDSATMGTWRTPMKPECFLLLLFSFFASSGLATNANAQGVDCLEKMPRDLVTQLGFNAPNFSVPATHDLDPASVGYDVRSGGDGCYVVAKGLFDEGQEAIAMVLIAKNGKPDLTVAVKRRTGWLLHHLPTFCDDIKYCYVKRGGPGTYVRSNALDAAPDRKSERTELTSDHDVLVSGRLESTGVTYVKDSGKWLYVWTSD
jgi:hypothetical protein